MSALPHRRYSEAEYLALEETAPERHQFVDGEIFNMAGAEPEHVTVVTNLAAGLTIRFRGKPCQAFTTDMRVRVGSARLWTYPDLSALCGKPIFDTSARPSSLLNPAVIFEVLSPSTEAFDRGDKFARYRTIETLREYVLVSCDRIRVEHFARAEAGRWILTVLEGELDTLSLPTLECELPLAEVYDKVSFPAPKE